MHTTVWLFIKMSDWPFLRNTVDLFERLLPVSSKLLSHFFEDCQIFFIFFSKCYPRFYNLLIFAKFLPSFLKTISVFLYVPKFYKKIQKPNFLKNFFNFFTNDNKLKLYYNICKVLSRKLEVFPKFH